MQHTFVLSTNELTGIVGSTVEYNGYPPATSIKFMKDGAEITIDSIVIVCEGAALKVRSVPESAIERRVEQMYGSIVDSIQSGA